MKAQTKVKKLDQNRTPYLDSYVKYLKSKPTCFDVPGHKMGKFETDLARKLSPVFSQYDVNAPYGMDNLAYPKGVIKEAEELMAEAMHSDVALFSVNGTSGGILAMFMGCLNEKDKVILPGNCHKSVINSLILSGATPVFVSPEIDEKLGVACGVKTSDYIKAMDDNKDAKAIFVINPTYFGVVSDLKKIVKEAHKRNMIVMVDEAHGSNFYFSDELPLSAMECQADISAVSFHKNSGSLTQSSVLLIKGNRVDKIDVKKALSMLTSTSPNDLLLCSLDAARKEMVLRGKEVLHEDVILADYAREEINKIPGLYCYGREYINKESGRYDIDITKLVIEVTGLGKYGYEAYKDLRNLYNIQVELGEVNVILVLISVGNDKEDIDHLISSLKDYSKRNYGLHKRRKFPTRDFHYPKTACNPREGYDAPYKIINLKDSSGEISAETVMAYPPGIPLIIPGEVFDKKIIDMIDFYHKEGGEIIKDTSIGKIKVIDKSLWKKNK